MVSSVLARVLLFQSAEAGFREGARLCAECKLVQAEETLKSALTIDPSYALAQFQLGAVYVGLGRFSDAAALFDKVLARHASSVEVRLRIGLIYHLSRRAAEARLHLEGTLSLDPKNFQAALIPGPSPRSFAGSSYLSQNELVIHLGLGDATEARGLVLRWPSGAEENLPELEAGRRYVVKEGVGVIGSH
ncbi:MAG TPA: tetratricopeptide repeat protein [Vicinamibacteria bacterium]|nr:tetratricopeptide repeat protein [Vicinamibacteria bacterium]